MSDIDRTEAIIELVTSYLRRRRTSINTDRDHDSMQIEVRFYASGMVREIEVHRRSKTAYQPDGQLKTPKPA